MRKVRFDDPALEQFQSNVAEVARLVEACPLIGGKLVENLSVYTTAENFEHGLGRRLRGFIVVRSNVDVRVFEPEAHLLPDRLVTLQATANAVVSLYYF